MHLFSGEIKYWIEAECFLPPSSHELYIRLKMPWTEDLMVFGCSFNPNQQDNSVNLSKTQNSLYSSLDL